MKKRSRTRRRWRCHTPASYGVLVLWSMMLLPSMQTVWPHGFRSTILLYPSLTCTCYHHGLNSFETGDTNEMNPLGLYSLKLKHQTPSDTNDHMASVSGSHRWGRGLWPVGDMRTIWFDSISFILQCSCVFPHRRGASGGASRWHERSAATQQKKKKRQQQHMFNSSTCTSLKLIPPRAVFISALFFCLKPVVDNSWTCQTITANNCLRSWNFLQMLVPAQNPTSLSHPPVRTVSLSLALKVSQMNFWFFPPQLLTLNRNDSLCNSKQ